MADRPHALSRLGGQSHVSLRGKAQEGRIGVVARRAESAIE